ncbi:MAG: T9SS type A sorting domain-containing protein [Bacteroidetes bacterium]|nr:T9SS type A sorting domain-containing protein [Bacteroidota bacterium]
MWYNIPVNLNHLPNGIYIVRMINDGKKFTEKLIIEK